MVPTAFEVGSIAARLGAIVEDRKFAEYDAHISHARREAARKIEADLGAEVDRRGFAAYERELAQAKRRALEMKAFKAHLGADFDRGAFDAYQRELGRAEGGSRRLHKANRDLDGGLLSITSRLPLVKWGAFAAGAFAAAPPVIALVSALGPLVGTLGALPGLAAAAGTGLLAGFLGTRGVGDALKAAWGAQVTAARDGTAAAQRNEAALDAVRTTQEALTGAQRNARDAQQALTLAHVEAQRRLEDMRIAALRAALGERDASLTLREARRELMRAETDPLANDLQIEGARNAVEGARIGLREARLERQRSRQDLGRETRHGDPGLAAAQRQVADANRAVADASRAATRAVRDEGRAMAEASGGAQKLQDEMSQLSPAGRAFVELMQRRFFPVAKELRATAQRGLLPGLGQGLVEASRNLPVLERGISRMSRVLGSGALDLGKWLGGRDAGRDFNQIFGQSANLMDHASDSALNFAQGLTDVAIAADPLTTWLGRVTERLSRQFEGWASTGRESGKLEHAFERVADRTETVARTLWNFGAGLVNVGKAADRAWGGDLIRNLDHAAKAFREWSGSRQGQRELIHFFDVWQARWSAVTGAIGDAIKRYRELRREGNSSMDSLAIAASEAFSGVLDVMVKNAAERADDVVVAFVKGFLAADGWGKIALGAWFINKLGGAGVIGNMGRRVAAGMIAGGAAGGGGGFVSRLLTHGLDRGSTPANPLFVEDVTGGGGGAGNLLKKGGGVLAGLTAGELGAIGGAAAVVAAPALITAYLTHKGVLHGSDTPATQELGRASPLSHQQRVRAGASSDDPHDENVSALAVRQGHVADEARKNIRDLRRDGVRDLRTLRDATQDNLKLIRSAFDTQTGKGRELAEANFKATATAVTRAMHDGKVSTKDGMAFIERMMRTHSEGGREGLSTALDAAAQKIRNTMHRAGVVTDAGMALVKRLMVDELKLYGLSERDAIASANVRSGEVAGGRRRGDFAEGGVAGLAGGGLVGRWGERGRDVVHAIVGRGEAILNFAQQRIVNRALAAVGVRGGLRDVFSMTRGTKHHYAAGGIVGIPGSPGMSIDRRILPDVLALRSRYRAGINAGYAPTGHAAGGEHPLGLAVDWVPGGGGSWNLIDRFAAFAEPSQNNPRYPFRWVGYDGDPDHGRGNHLHTSWLHGPGFPAAWVATLGGKVRGQLSTTIPRVVIRGRRSPLRAIAQASVDGFRRGAIKRVNRLLQTPAGGGGEGLEGLTYSGPLDRTFPSHSLANAAGHVQLSRRQVHGLHRRAGLPDAFDDVSWRESKNYPGVMGFDPGGTIGEGLHQITFGVQSPDTQGALHALGSSYNPWRNSLMARYLYNAAGHSMSPWSASGPYGGGGFAGSFAEGGFADRAKGIVGHTGKVAGRLRGGLSAFETRITDLDDLFQRRDARYSVSDETFVLSPGDRGYDEGYAISQGRFELDDQGRRVGLSYLNEPGIAKRSDELKRLVDIRRKIVTTYTRYMAAVQRIIHAYEQGQARLRRLLGKVSKKRAKPYRDDLERMGAALRRWRGVLSDLGDRRYGARTDLMEVRGELHELRPGAEDELEDPREAGPTADTGAQLEQLQQRLDVATQQARGATAALQAFTGPGDIGAGGATAYQAVVAPSGVVGGGYAVVGGRVVPVGGGGPADLGAGAGVGGVTLNQHNYMLSPSDPAVLDTVGRAAAAGIAGQGAPVSPRVAVNL